jgi:hypothetical protein
MGWSGAAEQGAIRSPAAGVYALARALSSIADEVEGMLLRQNAKQ